ncbi:hypothetical protein D3C87_1355280 [compost metagenome]
MFHDRHQFDVGKAQFLDVRNQALGQFMPGVLPGYLAQVIQFALPGPGMQFVDRQRRVGTMTVAARQHPVLILPVDAQRRSDFRRGVRRQRGGEGHRVGLEWQDAVAAEDFVFVGLPRLHARDEDFPDAGGMAQTHGVAATVPVVEVTDHRHPPGVRGPYGKAHAVDTVDCLQLCT